MIIENITREDYNALPGINASKLKAYYESSFNGNFENAKERDETDAMFLGTAGHSIVLESDKFHKNYRTFDIPNNPSTGKPFGDGTKKAQEYKDTLPKEFLYISQTQYDILSRIIVNLNRSKQAMAILNACPKRETAVTWIDEESGEECKALIDFLGDNLAGDFKTTYKFKYRETEHATSQALLWEMVANRNLLQFGFYDSGLKSNDIDVDFAVIFAKNQGNCDVLPALLSEETIQIGREMYNKAMLNWCNREKNTSAYQIITI